MSMEASAETATTVLPSSSAVSSEPNRQRGVSVPARQRSRVTNGTQLLPGVPNTNAWARRAKDVIGMHLSDMGGVDNTSAAERSIIRRAATLTVELERLEATFALAGQASADDLDLYQRTAGNLRRLLEAVGIQRQARDITPPDPLDYARDHT
jgi:hypothetical protein